MLVEGAVELVDRLIAFERVGLGHGHELVLVARPDALEGRRVAVGGDQDDVRRRSTPPSRSGGTWKSVV